MPLNEAPKESWVNSRLNNNHVNVWQWRKRKYCTYSEEATALLILIHICMRGKINKFFRILLACIFYSKSNLQSIQIEILIYIIQSCSSMLRVEIVRKRYSQFPHARSDIIFQNLVIGFTSHSTCLISEMIGKRISITTAFANSILKDRFHYPGQLLQIIASRNKLIVWYGFFRFSCKVEIRVIFPCDPWKLLSMYEIFFKWEKEKIRKNAKMFQRE